MVALDPSLPETHHATGHHAKSATVDYTLTAENHEGTTEVVATHADIMQLLTKQ